MVRSIWAGVGIAYEVSRLSADASEHTELAAHATHNTHTCTWRTHTYIHAHGGAAQLEDHSVRPSPRCFWGTTTRQGYSPVGGFRADH